MATEQTVTARSTLWIAYFYFDRPPGLTKAFSAMTTITRETTRMLTRSFPLQAPTWLSRLPDIFAAAPTEPLQWLQSGPTPSTPDCFSGRQ